MHHLVLLFTLQIARKESFIYTDELLNYSDYIKWRKYNYFLMKFETVDSSKACLVDSLYSSSSRRFSATALDFLLDTFYPDFRLIRVMYWCEMLAVSFVYPISVYSTKRKSGGEFFRAESFDWFRSDIWNQLEPCS